VVARLRSVNVQRRADPPPPNADADAPLPRRGHIKSFYMGMAATSWNATRSSAIPSDLKGSEPHTHNALDDAIEQAGMFERMLLASRSRQTDQRP